MPILNTLKTYRFEIFKADLIAGTTVGVVLIPQAIAYALLMGVPPIYGLYACLIPLIIYALLGTSTQLSIGPVAVTAILIMSGISQLAIPFSDTFVHLVIYTGLLIGIVQVLMSIFKMGFLTNLISQPVISGFISAAAIIIIMSQIKEALGINMPRYDQSYEVLIHLTQNFSEINIYTSLLFITAIILMLLLKRWKKTFPGALIVLVLGALATYQFGLNDRGVAIIGEVPKGLPSFVVPFADYQTLLNLLPTVFTVTLIGFIGSIGIAKSFEMKNRDHTVRANQELLALGISKILGAFFLAVPSSGSYSRSAINDQQGAKTTIASLVTAVLIIVSLLFFTKFFYYIPKSVLAAIIVLSVLGLLDFKGAKMLLKLRRREFLIMVITFLCTLFLSIEIGILIGVLLSFIFMLYYSSRPHVAELVNIPGTEYYRNYERFPEASKAAKYLILRFDNQLFFGNTNYFRETIMAALQKRETQPEFFILDMTNMHDIDSTGLHTLYNVNAYLSINNVQLLISGAIGPVRDFLKRSGFTEQLGVDHYFMTITEAVYFTAHPDQHPSERQIALQHNTQRSIMD
ncbi:SulP family inorganic anion transporter [Aquimarina intermedia]|uniref:SulP family sulfate permease n=1 Tax=Aquimarina intermedia TaxID=350814 RepID=A0A5S5CA37_9FLAO|nr:sulfate permease [Aquimarina intermedia]TYP75226.1 SulP family sulfate permease [Aquimarina intermedia]